MSNINLPIIKYNIKNHKDIKPLILDAINSMEVFSMVDTGQKISNTDWHLTNGYNRPYYSYIEPLINEINSNLKN
jgi:hypothetical protein